MEELNISEVIEFINEYTTKYPEGFTREEISGLLKKYGINSDVFYKSMFGNTYAMIENESVYYHGDVLRSLLNVINK